MSSNNKNEKISQLANCTLVFSSIDVEEKNNAVTINKSLQITRYPSKHKYYELYVNGEYSGSQEIDASKKITIPSNFMEPITLEIAIRTFRRETDLVEGSPRFVSHMSNSIEYTPTGISKIYGVEGEPSWDGNLVRTGDAVGLKVTPQVDPFSGKMSNYGLLLSDFKNVYPYSHMREVTDEYGNVFIRIPRFYVRVTELENGTYRTEITSTQKEGFYLHPCFRYGPRNLNYIDVGKYLTSFIYQHDSPSESGGFPSLTAVARSIPGVIPSTTSAERSSPKEYYVPKPLTAVGANTDSSNFEAVLGNPSDPVYPDIVLPGSNDVKYLYFSMDIWVLDMLQILFKIEFASTNSRAFMQGKSVSYTGLPAKTGSCMSCDPQSVGSIGNNMDARNAMSFHGIEDLWGNLKTYIAGIACYIPNPTDSHYESKAPLISIAKPDENLRSPVYGYERQTTIENYTVPLHSQSLSNIKWCQVGQYSDSKIDYGLFLPAEAKASE